MIKKAVILGMILASLSGCSDNIGANPKNSSGDKENILVEENIEGFANFHNDGFSMQTPTDWGEFEINLEYEDPNNTQIDYEKKAISKQYKLYYPNDFNYTVVLDIVKYNKMIDFDAFLAERYIKVGDYQEVNVPGADKAYAFIDYKDDIYETSTRSLIVFKNDIFYKLEASHYNTAGANWTIDYDRENIKDFRNDIEVMFSSFKIFDR